MVGWLVRPSAQLEAGKAAKQEALKAQTVCFLCSEPGHRKDACPKRHIYEKKERQVGAPGRKAPSQPAGPAKASVCVLRRGRCPVPVRRRWVAVTEQVCCRRRVGRRRAGLV